MAIVCVPSESTGGLGDRVSAHFGHAPVYTLWDSESGEVRVVPNDSEHMGGRGLPADNLAALGIDVLLCGGIGRKAIDLCAARGIEVFVGPWGTVGDAIEDWRAGRATPAGLVGGCGGGGRCG